jgi:hypothetical protein
VQHTLHTQGTYHLVTTGVKSKYDNPNLINKQKQRIQRKTPGSIGTGHPKSFPIIHLLNKFRISGSGGKRFQLWYLS